MVIMNKQLESNKKIQLVFPRHREQDVHLPKDLSHYKDRNFFDLFTTDVDELLNWFGKFKVGSIEIVVDSIINTEQETKIFVGNKGDEIGMKLILEQKENSISSLHIDENHDNSSKFNEL
jgi:hypothetical protein